MRDVISEYEAIRVRSPNMGKWEYANRICKFIETLTDAERDVFRRHTAAEVVKGMNR